MPRQPRFIARVARVARVVGVCAAAIALWPPLGTPARAQTAAQITPPTFRPDLPRVTGAVVFSGEPGLEAPPGADRLSVTIAGVAVEGALPELAAAGAALEARLVGGPVAVSEIFAAAQDYEAAYARAGFVLVRVVLPAQDLRDGDRLRLVVVNGFIERADVQGVPAPIRRRVEAVIAPLVGVRGLTLDAIERRLLIAGDSPGVALGSTLSPGDEPGGTVLVVDARFRPVTGFVSLDNTLANSLGPWTLTLGAEANGVFGFGETTYFRLSGHPRGDFAPDLGSFLGDNPRLRTVAAGAILPLGTNGLTFNLEATASQTTPDLPGEDQTGSNFERLSFRLAYPWRRSRALDITTELIFDATSEEQYVIADGGDQPFAKDRLRVLRFAADLTWRRANGGVLTAGAIASFGLDALGARSVSAGSPDVPLTRADAEPDFQSLAAAVSYAQSLTDRLAFSLFARGQTSFGQPLVQSEQIGIASFQELSTFDAGTIGGDSGWVVRGDLLSPWNVETARLPLLVTPYVFAATGRVTLEEPTALERASLRASSLGVGLELSTLLDPQFSQATVVFEFGRAYQNGSEPDENRATLVASYQF
jgi:hemolysin activation/secretion protein